MARKPHWNSAPRTRSRKADARERDEKAGIVRREYRMHADDVAQADAYIERLRRARERAA